MEEEEEEEEEAVGDEAVFMSVGGDGMDFGATTEDAD
jgi:hypothetical protein